MPEQETPESSELCQIKSCTRYGTLHGGMHSASPESWDEALANGAPPSPRPWLCPEGRCTPLLNLRDGDYKDITVPEPGESFTCFGRMAEPVRFVYDGVDHTNDCNACHYTPLKGLIRWQENPGDWETLSTYYALAARLARQTTSITKEASDG